MLDNNKTVADLGGFHIVKNEFYDVNDVVDILGVSKPKAYAIMRQLNMELSNQGYIVVSGKVSSRYFSEKLYLSKVC